MTKGLIAIAAALVILGGCGTPASEKPRKTPRGALVSDLPPQKSADAPVDIFLTKKPERPYREIGLVRTTEDNAGDLVQDAKFEVRKFGGDAAIIDTNGGSTTSEGPVRTTGHAWKNIVIIQWAEGDK